jgi:hypothetical protein
MKKWATFSSLKRAVPGIQARARKNLDVFQRLGSIECAVR